MCASSAKSAVSAPLHSPSVASAWSAGIAKSTKPVEIALSGIEGWRGPWPSATCAMVSPPRSLIALVPKVPSPSPPESTTD